MTIKEKQQIIGKTFDHKKFGKVQVIECVERSQTKVVVEQIDRGRGWDEELQIYTGWKTSTGDWSRGQNYGFGKCDTVHINELKPRKNEPVESEL
ncbi:MAG: hypothetical protein KAR20_06205 [Candidatus Heimdallarchaeota archaeon]|nr:hypothetical protein [Candidatus Heimdallarchaeota archaeon]